VSVEYDVARMIAAAQNQFASWTEKVEKRAYCGTRGSPVERAKESGALILDRAASAFLT
jgi:hypothetical protein